MMAVDGRGQIANMQPFYKLLPGLDLIKTDNRMHLSLERELRDILE